MRANSRTYRTLDDFTPDRDIVPVSVLLQDLKENADTGSGIGASLRWWHHG
jgi:hypothetical protein